MSPEQGQARPVDARSDIYSVGVLFYEMLTNEKPYYAKTPSALIEQHIHADIPTLEGELGIYQPILRKLLAKNPDDRYQSVSDILIRLHP